MSRLTDWVPAAGAGVWSVLGPAAAEAVSHGGPAWIGLDWQHGLYDDRAVIEALRAITAVDVLVRVPSHDAAAIGRALDAGARGVIVPMVESAEQAAAMAAAVRYPPVGVRSWGPLPGSPERAVGEADARAVCGVMVESRRGLEHVEQIAATTGVDLIFVGPIDLALSMGEAGDLGDALKTILAACERHDVIPGAFAGTSDRTAEFAGLGFRVLAATTDRKLLVDGVSRYAGISPPG